MLRYGFLPSDYHPMMLFLGEVEDLSRFADLLLVFSADGHEIKLEEHAFLQAAEPTWVLLTASGGSPGMHLVAAPVRSFVWALEPARAAVFANMISELTRSDCKSGSVFLEAPGDELKVKVSLGEYTDDFLAPEAAAKAPTPAQSGT